MTPEIPIPIKDVVKLINGLPCPQPGCEGKIQIYETPSNPEPLKAACYSCGQQIDLHTVRILYETKGGEK